ncbi:MAG: hypothetical protein F6J92_24110 [Symploca sp. SIO1A3]|nr:hypothetical protein [Symploca sp. SIO1A3]
MMFNFIGLSASLGLLTLLVFGLLQWLHISAGHFLDWVIAVLSFWWLLAIVTVPWNVHLEAREVLAEAGVSRNQGIAVDAKQIDYVKTLSKRSLIVAISLHLLSAAGLYTLAATGISAVGYITSGAALLLTALRPAVRFYEYLAARLAMIRREFKYPREDIMELRSRFDNLESTVQYLSQQIDLENSDSLAATQQQYAEKIRQDLVNLKASVEQLAARNEAEHQRLALEAQQGISQLTVDSQFLEHVREIIRFFKET